MPGNVIVTATGTGPTGHGPLGVNINAEDVLDLIIDVTPWENPVVTLLPKVQATSTRHEWVNDFLQNARPRHGIGEGVDFGADQTVMPTKLRTANYLQHFRYETKVSNLQRLMNPYGISDQYAYEIGKLTKQIGKDIEARILEDTVIGSGAAATFHGSESAGRMRTFIELLAGLDATPATGTGGIANGSKPNIRDAETLTATTTATGIWDATTPLLANVDQVALTETIVTKALSLSHGGGAGGGDGSGDSGGGHPDTMVVSPAVYGMIGAWGSSSTGAYPFPSTLPPLTNARLARVVRFYDSNFGLIEVVNSRYCPQAINVGAATTFVRGTNPSTQETGSRNCGNVYLFERNRLRLAFARGVQHISIPPAGDAVRGMVVADVTLELLGARTGFCLWAVNNV